MSIGADLMIFSKGVIEMLRMTRNQIMLRLYKLRELVDVAGDHAMVRELANLENDLCNAPNARNMGMGIPTYTLKMARRELQRYEARMENRMANSK